MSKRLQGKTALISGAGRNNGRAIALRFAEEGADLVLVVRELEDQLKAVAAECEAHGVRTVSVVADMTDPVQVRDVVAQGIAGLGRIDIAVNVVGLRPHRPFMDYTNEEWMLGFAVNTHTLFHLTQALWPSMTAQGSGSIIALGGMSSVQAMPDSALVVASKHALHGLVKSLARELGPYGVRVNLLNPGSIENIRKNPEWYAMTGGEPTVQADLSLIPLRRKGNNSEVANVALFLASDDSSYVTGDRIACVGGRVMS
jgi:3-oxoacyl-[acyl-carrier protein] reductase/2-deoxy-D-gluconate 3-dehydrogenase